MILWTIKQILSLRTAFTGRANPHQLAWGLALGVAIGLVPKGNLVSLMLIGFLVTVRVNHGVAALAAVVLSFVAVRLDPWTHAFGASILQSPQSRPTLERLWDLPLVPWTSLNNTVVMGSTIMAIVSIVPTYVLTLPIFRSLSPRPAPESTTGPDPTPAALATAPSTASNIPPGPRHAPEPVGVPMVDTSAPQHVETQIDIIRLERSDSKDGSADDASSVGDGSMNEALGYLLRRLRDSRQGKAA